MMALQLPEEDNAAPPFANWRPPPPDWMDGWPLTQLEALKGAGMDSDLPRNCFASDDRGKMLGGGSTWTGALLRKCRAATKYRCDNKSPLTGRLNAPGTRAQTTAAPA